MNVLSWMFFVIALGTAPAFYCYDTYGKNARFRGPRAHAHIMLPIIVLAYAGAILCGFLRSR